MVGDRGAGSRRWVSWWVCRWEACKTGARWGRDRKDGTVRRAAKSGSGRGTRGSRGRVGGMLVGLSVAGECAARRAVGRGRE